MSRILKKALGCTYGGPSISYEKGEFVLYVWGDAPVGWDILVSDPNWNEFLKKVEEWQKQQ